MTPLIFERGEKGERAYDIFSRLMKDRIIYIGGAIDDDVANVVSAQLTFLDGQDQQKAIDIYINSPGGLITAGLAIYDTMQFIRAPIRTTCIGQACSMGAVLLLAGRKGDRASLPRSRIMLHQPSGGAVGTAAEVRIMSKEIDRLQAILYDIISEHTGQTQDAVRAELESDKYMSPSEAKDWGIIDEIVTKRPVLQGESREDD